MISSVLTQLEKTLLPLLYLNRVLRECARNQLQTPNYLRRNNQQTIQKASKQKNFALKSRINVYRTELISAFWGEPSNFN